MNNDGWGQMGAGPSDMRIGGDDLQHYRQLRTADEKLQGYSKYIKPLYNSGGPVKEMLDVELKRHQEARQTYLKQLEDHYKR